VTTADSTVPGLFARTWAGTRQAYIASPGFDLVFFLLSPLLILAAAEAAGAFEWPFERTRALGDVDMRLAFCVGVFSTAHLFGVFFRSHANGEIFAQHRLRFLAVPPLLFAALVLSEWALVCAFVLAAAWDIWHTALQNFGIGRIYDARLGNPPEQGRQLDIVLHLLVYVGPLVAGPSLYRSLQDVERFGALGWDAPARGLAGLAAIQSQLAPVILAGGALFLVYYVLSYRRLVRGGYRVSRQKIVMLVSVAATSIFAWSVLPPLEAMVITTSYHALQYFGIVWWAEKRSIRRVLGLRRIAGGALAFAAWMAVLLLAALATEAGSRSTLRAAWAFGLVVALIHFWYDGFIWSVRRREVRPG